MNASTAFISNFENEPRSCKNTFLKPSVISLNVFQMILNSKISSGKEKTKNTLTARIVVKV